MKTARATKVEFIKFPIAISQIKNNKRNPMKVKSTYQIKYWLGKNSTPL